MVYDLDPPEIPTKLAEPTPAKLTPPEDSSETFCGYLARQFVAKKGFEAANIPEVQKLVGSSDFVLSRSNGFGLTILCMVDREKYPGESFGLDVNEVRQIGDACGKYAAKIGPARMPVFIRIMEIGPGATVRQQQRLKQFRRSSWTSRVVPSAMIIDPVAAQAWNSEKRRFIREAIKALLKKCWRRRVRPSRIQSRCKLASRHRPFLF